MCHVLIIEDEPFVAMLIEDVLLAEGVRTIAIAACEEDAIAQAIEHRPDFITSDVTLTAGTGPNAVQAIRDIYGSIPVLFITATPDGCRHRSLPNQILQKPASSVRIAACYHEMMGR